MWSHMYFSIWWEKHNKRPNSCLHAYKESKFNLCIIHPLIPVLSLRGLAWGSLAVARTLALLRCLRWESILPRRAPPALSQQRGPSPGPRGPTAALPPRTGAALKPQPPSPQGPACTASSLAWRAPPHSSETTRSVKNVPPWDSSQPTDCDRHMGGVAQTCSGKEMEVVCPTFWLYVPHRRNIWVKLLEGSSDFIYVSCDVFWLRS